MVETLKFNKIWISPRKNAVFRARLILKLETFHPFARSFATLSALPRLTIGVDARQDGHRKRERESEREREKRDGAGTVKRCDRHRHHLAAYFRTLRCLTSGDRGDKP